MLCRDKNKKQKKYLSHIPLCSIWLQKLKSATQEKFNHCVICWIHKKMQHKCCTFPDQRSQVIYFKCIRHALRLLIPKVTNTILILLQGISIAAIIGESAPVTAKYIPMIL